MSINGNLPCNREEEQGSVTSQLEKARSNAKLKTGDVVLSPEEIVPAKPKQEKKPAAKKQKTDAPPKTKGEKKAPAVGFLLTCF
jgi:hypothetical protein